MDTCTLHYGSEKRNGGKKPLRTWSGAGDE